MLPSFLGICHVGGGGGCPAAGTVVNTLVGVPYPVAEGGAYVTLDPNGVNGQYPTQTCDVEVKADGSCGTYTDWSTVSNVAYLPYGTLLAEDEVGFDRGYGPSPYIEINCTEIDNVPACTIHAKFLSDGSGGAFSEDVNNPFYAYGTSTNFSNPYWVNGEGCDPDNPIQVNVFWDGNGGYYYETI